MFAKNELEVRDNDDTYKTNPNRQADWNEFNDTDMVDFSLFIQKKYYT